MAKHYKRAKDRRRRGIVFALLLLAVAAAVYAVALKNQGRYAKLAEPEATPAEVAALRALGVSYVGMSTVCEVIMAKALGMHVLGLTLAANESGAPAVSHESVLEAAGERAEDFERLVRGVLGLL